RVPGHQTRCPAPRPVPPVARSKVGQSHQRMVSETISRFAPKNGSAGLTVYSPETCRDLKQGRELRLPGHQGSRSHQRRRRWATLIRVGNCTLNLTYVE